MKHKGKKSALTDMPVWLAVICSAGAGGMLSSCGQSGAEPHKSAAATQSPQMGHHGGRLLKQGDAALEVRMAEGEGQEPRIVLYGRIGDTPVPLDPARVSMTLSRIDGTKDSLHFRSEGDHLVSIEAVAEPHSFDVAVTADIAGKPHRWAYPQYEGRVAMSAARAKTAGITTEVAGPETMKLSTTLGGAVSQAAPGMAEFNLMKDNFADVKVGQPVFLQSTDGRPLGQTRVGAIRTPAEDGSRLTVLSASLPPQAAGLKPGTPLHAVVQGDSVPVPLAVRTVAIQHFHGKRVVLAKFGDQYEVRMLDIGRQTPEWTEVKSGLAPNTTYIVGNVFALGRGLDRNEAEHAH